MKKAKYLVLLVFLLGIGCSNKSSEEMFEEAYDNMNKLENYMVESTMKMELSKDGSNFKMTMTSVSKIDQKNKVSYTKVSGSFFGQSLEEKAYSMIKDNKKITYTEYGSIWYKEQKEDIQEEIIKIEEITADKFKEIIEEEIEGRLYKVILSTESIKDIFSNNTIQLNYEKAEVYIVVKDQDITMSIIKAPGKMKIEDQNFDIIVESVDKYSLRNKVGVVEIPSHIIHNALDEEGYNTYLDIESYLDAISYAISYDTTIYTNTKCEYYEGTYPTEVNIAIEDGYIGNGYIKMNGYLAKISDGEISKFKFLIIDSHEKL